jgi:protein-S-isoprenylcysteine O-methyltransferase Ste14
VTEHTGWWRGKRGEWYVVIQAGLFGLVLIGPWTLPGIPAWPPAARLPAGAVGGLLLLAGALLAGAGAYKLGRYLTPLPKPKDDGQLVETGAYRLVRHPIYGGIILICYGWGFCSGSLATLGYASLVCAFLDLKSRREERWLRAKFPGYDGYRNRVRKLIPYIY